MVLACYVDASREPASDPSCVAARRAMVRGGDLMSDTRRYCAEMWEARALLDAGVSTFTAMEGDV